MVSDLKNLLYFPIASYFRFFASYRLRRWKPQIIVVTGSSGKTTLLHMVESQLGLKARYSYHANSSFGIPFDILDLHRHTFSIFEWLELVIKAPISAFKKPFDQKLYVVEADCDRPNEGKFLAKLLQPDITLWLNSSKTHGMNFEALSNNSLSVDELIAYEFGYFVEYCKDLLVINGDNSNLVAQIRRAEKQPKVVAITIKDLKDFKVNSSNTEFKTKEKIYKINGLLPEASFYSLRMTEALLNHLNLPFDSSFSNFKLPPGRATVLKGIQGITIVDSSYNANLSSMRTILEMFDKLSQKVKWVVLGDMLELGKSEKSEHEELANILIKLKPEKIILIGKLVSEYTYPLLIDKFSVVKFMNASDSINYIKDNINGGETILFKGSQGIKLEGIIEKLLLDGKDVLKLPRQTEFWKEWRRKANL